MKLPTLARMTAVLFVAAVAQFPYPAYSQETNGCGSGVERYVVPDRLRIIGCDFKQSCDQHDICYGACTASPKENQPPQCEYLRCQSGGDIYGQQTCDSVKFRRLRIAAEERRAVCDSKFMVDIVKNNPGNSRCTLFSALYPFAVRVLGSKSFVGIDSVQAMWPEEDKEAYARAINDLYSQWPDSRIEQYSKAFNEGKAKVDLSRPIRFDPTRGLVNITR